jgi:dUTP pyrophosphatase
MEKFLVARLRPDAYLPTRKHPEDAGLDFYAVDPVTVGPFSISIVPTGITVEIPPGMAGLLKPKGSSNHLVGAGVVDAGYQGEILIKVANPTTDPIEFKPGDPIGQMVLLPVVTPQVEETSLDEIHSRRSARSGSGGIVDQHRTQS